MTLSHWQRLSSGATIHCDFAVVGGGIAGCSTAYWLKKNNPGLSVTLIESCTLGFGASGRNAGFLLQGAAVDYATDVEKYGEQKARLLWRFTQENRRLIESELDGSSFNLTGGGSLILAGSKEEDDRLRHAMSLLDKLGEQVMYWPADKVEQQIKGVGFMGGLFVPTGARVDSIKLVREIAGRSGAMVLEGHPVVAVEREAAGVRLLTRKRNIIARHVVFCLNAYLPLLLPETSPFIRPVRAQMMATEPLDVWLDYPVYSHEGYYYVRQLTTGELLVGGARHLHVEEEVGFEDRTTTHLQQSLKDYVLQYFPHIKEVTTKYAWSGVMSFTRDGLPIFAEVESIPGCYWAGGFNGHGMGYGFHFGKMVAGAFSNDSEDIDYRMLFDINRFSMD